MINKKWCIVFVLCYVVLFSGCAPGKREKKEGGSQSSANEKFIDNDEELKTDIIDLPCQIGNNDYKYYDVGILVEKNGEQLIKCIENYARNADVPDSFENGEVVVIYYNKRIRWEYSDIDESSCEYGTVDQHSVELLEGCILNAKIVDYHNSSMINEYEADGGPYDGYLISIEGELIDQNSFIILDGDVPCALSGEDSVGIFDEIEIKFNRDNMEIVEYTKK